MSLAVSAFALDSDAIPSLDFIYARRGPQLLSPVTHTIDLNGKDFLEFRWLDDMARTDRFVLKIYRGYNMYAKNLVYRQDVAPHATTFRMRSVFFETGQVYTWSLVRVSIGGEKSDRSFSSFKVIKK
ncbi:MAG TPA: hypothetical protein PLJ26_02300 [Candidatus Omnitrophota bacterium]|nr:hypothetical protein [Candidatus Omnitrophota bacterium]HQJ15305.1 hypothetical protein [Candidatus Omnitrophota bacterium]